MRQLFVADLDEAAGASSLRSEAVIFVLNGLRVEQRRGHLCIVEDAGPLTKGKLDLPHFRSGFLRAMLAIAESGYGTQT